ncbi:mitochondrial thiamine pyrophosphate carrier-like [Mytilus edulis]|uniref:mitochondrial thiamine pyrophosphate carrier-like n=1 Tax=Mytilus edulis TaxID=6550 RepID=UPI0039EE0A7D
MVGYRPEEYKLSSQEYAAVGAFSGFVARVVCQPFDVLKIRFQLQVEPVCKPTSTSFSKYWGIRQAFQSIIKEEGVTALWKGHVPAQILSVAYGFTQFASFELLTSVAWRFCPHEFTTKHRPIVHTVCGGLAGCIAITVAQPMDVLRTRFVAQGNEKIYSSLYSGIQTMIKEEGFLSFYKGLGAAVAQIGPQMGLQFGFFALFTRLWRGWFDNPGHKRSHAGVTEVLVCGSSAGAIAKTIIYPLDVIKKRLEIQGFEKARKGFGAVRHYNGLWDCMITIMKEEGSVRGLYKGLSPGLIKGGLAAGANYLVYDQVCYLLRKYHSS